VKSKLPNGLITLAIFLLITSAWSIRFLARSDAQMIFFGQVLSGLSFKAYYAGLSITNVIIAIGLLYRRRWSYLGYFIISAWCAFLAIVNICVTTNDALIQSGWKLVDSRSGFRTIQGLGVVLIVVMAFWLFCYRRQFQSGNR